MWFSRQDYWSGLPFPTPGYLPDPGIEFLHLLYWQTDSLPLSYLGSPQQLLPSGWLFTWRNQGLKGLSSFSKVTSVVHRKTRIQNHISDSRERVLVQMCPSTGMTRKGTGYMSTQGRKGRLLSSAGTHDIPMNFMVLVWLLSLFHRWENCEWWG